MKKVLVISGSARKKGNTMEMVKIVEEELKVVDNSIEVEYMYLINKNLKFCIGCNRCLTHGGSNCPLKDDKSEILEAMHRSDAIIFASPGYAHMVSGMMKNFIDRFMFLDHTPEFVGKPSMIVSTAGGDGASKAPNYMYNMSFGWWGCNNVAIFGIPHSFFAINAKYRAKTTKKLKVAAQKLVNEMNRTVNKKPSFKQYLFFMFNKTELKLSDKVMPYRTNYWNERGWMQMDYYYKTSVNPIYKFICAIMFKLMLLGFRFMLGKDANQKLATYVQNQ